MLMKRRTILGLTIATAAMLPACGFQLRGSSGHELPFKTVYVAFPETSPVGIELRRYIRATGDTSVVTDPKAAQAVLELLSESREKTVLSLNSQGRVREYSLFYKLRFRVKDGADKELLAPTDIVLKRDISFNESQVMAKEHEEAMLYRDMQSDVVRQVLRRLSALKTA
jgi:LPS-assembly lipoprotein